MNKLMIARSLNLRRLLLHWPTFLRSDGISNLELLVDEVLLSDMDRLSGADAGQDVEDLGMAGGWDLGVEDELVHIGEAMLLCSSNA